MAFQSVEKFTSRFWRLDPAIDFSISTVLQPLRVLHRPDGNTCMNWDLYILQAWLGAHIWDWNLIVDTFTSSFFSKSSPLCARSTVPQTVQSSRFSHFYVHICNGNFHWRAVEGKQLFRQFMTFIKLPALLNDVNVQQARLLVQSKTWSGSRAPPWNT